MNRQLSTIENDGICSQKENNKIFGCSQKRKHERYEIIGRINHLFPLNTRNYTLCLTTQDLLVIPFADNQYVMPFETTSVAILNDITTAELKYYLRGMIYQMTEIQLY